nr:MAK10-like protein [Tanacetum cinerariifolium]
MENPSQMHGLVSRTYFIKSLIMASIFGSKSKTFMTTSLSSQDEPLTNQPVASFMTDAKESEALLEDLALYDNESWNDPRDFAKPVKEISLSQDVPSTSDCCLIELKNQVQRLMEAHLAPMQPTQVNKITSSCEIYSGPNDTHYCMEILNKPLLSMHPCEPTGRESSLTEQNRNPTSLKRVHFVNSIIVLNKEDKAKEEGNVKTSTTEYEDHEMIVESEDDFKKETKDEIKEEEEDSLKHFDTSPL